MATNLPRIEDDGNYLPYTKTDTNDEVAEYFDTSLLFLFSIIVIVALQSIPGTC